MPGTPARVGSVGARMDDVLGYCTALGLATAAGLNAWIPLLATGLLARYTGLIDLDDTWDVLEQTPVLIALGAVAAPTSWGTRCRPSTTPCMPPERSSRR